MTKKLLVIIDTQADFMLSTGALYVTGAEQLIAPINNYLLNLPADIDSVIMTYDTHFADTYPDSEEAKQFPIHCVYNTPGWQNVFNDASILGRDEVNFLRLEKPVFDMWATSDTMRDNFIDGVSKSGVKDVVVIGVAADFCVHWAVNGFVERGFNVEIPRSLTAGIVRDIDTVVAEEYAGKNVKVID